ncbi:PREDICTED: band 7 protein AAEL010189-like [Priapulus caudatus]|uniref:Band 7 protein AAEL010189-like n=1 Tax=Priapulus caudatus TaxID=37621 RepID=A0ABM1E957_PRICU|nr:PREDICTED: band 7 protein AAEL010189-like [Priapulus caudatus]
MRHRTVVKDWLSRKGIFFVVPCTDEYKKVDLRTISFDVPPQEIFTKDSVTVAVDAVIYLRIKNATAQSILDEATDPWGILVERVELKDVRLPVQLQRAMAAEAEASREARAKVIAAEGEQRAARALREAADVMGESSGAMQLRYLQTLNSISAEKNSTIIFPIPIEMMSKMSSGKPTRSPEHEQSVGL